MASLYYYYVQSGAITDPPPKTIYANGREVTANPFPRPYAIGDTSIGADAPDSYLAALGVYRLVVTERGVRPGLDYLPTTGELTVDTNTGTVQRVDGWREMIAEELAAALADAKESKIEELKEEAGARFAAINPWIDSIDAYEVLEAIILTIKAASRNPIPDLLLSIKAVADAGKAARTAILALSTLDGVAAYDVSTDPTWPA